VTDFESGKDMGRIYRVVAATPNKPPAPKGKKQAPKKAKAAAKKIDLATATLKQLCDELENPNVWRRMTAHRLLLERQDQGSVWMLEQLAKGRNRLPEARVQAMHLLDALGTLKFDLLERQLDDADAVVAEHAIQLAEPRLAKSPALVTRVLELADDPNPRVRFQCALSLGESGDDRIVAALVRIAAHGMEDKWTRAAVLSSVAKREDKFLQALLPVATAKATEGFPALMGELGRILGASQPQPKLFPVLRELLAANRPEDLAWQLAAVGGFGDGLRARGLGSKETPALLSLVNEDSSNLRAQVDKLFSRAAELTTEANRPMSEKLAAIALLAEGDYGLSGSTLGKLIEPQQPVEIQSAAVRALGRMVSSEKASVLVQRARWNAYTPTVRDAVLTVVTGNTNLLPALFTAIEAGDVAAYTVNADRRNQLMHHKDEAIKSRAEKLFKDLTPGDRMKVYEETKSILTLKGDGKNGHALFQKNCITCHTFSGEGKQVGPDLTGIRNQPAEVILLHVVVPEYEINPIYTAYNVETKGGDSYAGLLAAETPGSITLRMAQGLEQQIPRADIASMTTSRLSLMPQELEKAMTKQELADLLAFLKGQ